MAWWSKARMAVPSWRRRLDEYRQHLIIGQGRSNRTAETYTWHVDRFHRWCLARGVDALSARVQHVHSHYTDLLNTRARNYALNRVLALRSFYKWEVAQGRRRKDPTSAIAIRRPKLEARTPYTNEEIGALLAACRSTRDRALILFAAGSACRRQEMIDMRVADVDWERGLVLVKGKGDKMRRVAPGLKALAALRHYLDIETRFVSGYVWRTHDGRRLTPQRAYLQLREIADRAGVTNASWHRFRVSAANHLTSAGMALDELQIVMGHADIKTTAHYAGFTAKARALDVQRQHSLADSIAG